MPSLLGVALISARLYVADPVPLTQVLSTQHEVDAVLATAHISVQWVVCSTEYQPAACAVPPEPHDLIIRVRSGFAETTVDSVLGAAIVDTAAGQGSFATVYADRVRALAVASGAPFSTVLGRAIAHEVGHLVLGHTRHSARGLMRRHWTRHEVRRDTSEDWTFTEADAEDMRLKLSARNDARRSAN